MVRVGGCTPRDNPHATTVPAKTTLGEMGEVGEYPTSGAHLLPQAGGPGAVLGDSANPIDFVFRDTKHGFGGVIPAAATSFTLLGCLS